MMCFFRELQAAITALPGRDGRSGRGVFARRGGMEAGRLCGEGADEPMSFKWLIGVVHHCSPSAVITYHPGGVRPLKLAAYLNKMGIYALAHEEINTMLEI